jgi:hypothetical protein
MIEADRLVRTVRQATQQTNDLMQAGRQYSTQVTSYRQTATHQTGQPTKAGRQLSGSGETAWRKGQLIKADR